MSTNDKSTATIQHTNETMAHARTVDQHNTAEAVHSTIEACEALLQKEAFQDAKSPVASKPTFCLHHRRDNQGLTKFAGSASLFVVGGFLLSQATLATSLAIQTGFLGLVGIAAGVLIARVAVLELFGSLIVNDEGVSIRPSFCGFTVPWQKLERWELPENNSPSTENCQQFRIWERDEDSPVLVDASWLTTMDRHLLRMAMLSRKPASASPAC